MKLLVEEGGADVNIRDNFDRTPAGMATEPFFLLQASSFVMGFFEAKCFSSDIH